MKMWILRSAIGNENVSPVVQRQKKKKKNTNKWTEGGEPLLPCPLLPLSPGKRSELVSHQPRANPKLKLHQEAITIS